LINLTIRSDSKDHFHFGGICPTQLFAKTIDGYLLYGRFRGNRFSLDITKQCEKCASRTLRKGECDSCVKRNSETLIRFRYTTKEGDDGYIEWDEFLEVCRNNGINIRFFNAVDYMKENKK